MLIFELSSEGRGATAQFEGSTPVTDIPQHHMRAESAGLPEVSELQVVRHFTNLSKKNFSIDGQFYPLGHAR